jgi:8-oxo-dGTP diphosphatase
VDVAIALIFDEKRERILMVKNENDDSSWWSMPGGAVEPGETLDLALIRETKEECGLDVEMVGLHSVREVFFSNRGHHALLFTFLAKISGGEINISDPDGEVKEVKWMELSQANRLMWFLPDELKIRATDADRLVPYYNHGTE